MTLAEARAAVAAALSGVDGYAVRARPFTAAPRPGDGWVVVGRVAPATFTACLVTLTAVLVLGSDEAKADERLDNDSTALVGAVTGSDALRPADVSLEPQAIAVGTGAPLLYAAALTLTLEVE